jgi:DHA1 family tetracycline resistance protein-like MFS transporter
MALAPSLEWLFVGRLISGITAASISTAFAYIAASRRPKRAGAFGMVGAAFGVGFVIGPALGGVLGNIDPRLPFWVAGSMALVNAAYGLFVLPGRCPRTSAPFAWKRATRSGRCSLRRHRELLGLRRCSSS